MSRLLTASHVYLYAGSSKSSTGHAAEASRQSSCCSSFHAASRAGPRSSPGPVRGRSFCTTCHVSFPARHLRPLKRCISQLPVSSSIQIHCRCSFYTPDASVQLQGKHHSGNTDCEHPITFADSTPKKSAAAAPASAPVPF